MSNFSDVYLDDNFEEIKKGFRINSIKMRDGETQKLYWESKDWDLNFSEKEEKIPSSILQSKIVKREINFSTKEAINDLKLIQNFYLYNELFESTNFNFGFVIPESTNTWEQIIQAKSEDEMLSAEILSGNLVVETIILSKGYIIAKNRIRITYI